MANTSSRPGVATYPDFDTHSVETNVTPLTVRVPVQQLPDQDADDEVIERARPSFSRKHTASRPKRVDDIKPATEHDLADPAYAAMLAAKVNQLNDSLHRIAADRARDQQAHLIEIDRLEKLVVSGNEAVAASEAKRADLEKDLDHSRELIRALKGSAPYQLTMLLKIFMVSLAVFSAAAFANTYFSF